MSAQDLAPVQAISPRGGTRAGGGAAAPDVHARSSASATPVITCPLAWGVVSGLALAVPVWGVVIAWLT
jgi:hypothetical protein